MRLESIAIHLRRRSAWEALDLGHAMWRAWAPRLYRAWFASYWLAGVALTLLLWSWPQYVLFALWWLKPLFDRVLLWVCSRSAFGEETSVKDVWRAFPALCRSPGVLSTLSLRRFSLVRSFLLPVWQLEEQRGDQARARLKLLARRYRSHAVWLTFFCANMSSILMFSLLIVLALLAPGDNDLLSSWQLFSKEAPRWQHLASTLLYMLAETVIEPLYVASGFSLYLNRRSELEAWDVELDLRRLAERRSTSAATPLLLLLSVLLLAPLYMPVANAALPPAACAAGDTCTQTPPADDAQDEPPLEAPLNEEATPSTAASPAEAARPRSPAKVAIQAVLDDPVFGRLRDDWRWRWRSADDTAGATESGWFDALWQAYQRIGEGLTRFFDFLAEILRGMLWLFGGLLLLAIIGLAIRYRHLFTDAASVRQSPPDFLFGLDLRPGSLPPDILAAVRACLAEEKTVEALSLLYRGALVALIDDRQIEFRIGDTENDCLRRIAGHVPDDTQHCLGEIVAAWCLAAYGRQAISTQHITTLATAWQRCFAPVEVRR
ncbi:MAG TPA: hypothetical protein PLF25_01175 [Accumulibacter sp.]|nr:hypothetical protein [Accumulibacter sp.]